LSDEDIALLAAQGSHVVHCPVSNMKLGCGIAPTTALMERGVNVALGTDGAASNNRVDLFSEMRMAALLAKVATGDPSVWPAQQALTAATLSGARALGSTAKSGHSFREAGGPHCGRPFRIERGALLRSCFPPGLRRGAGSGDRRLGRRSADRREPRAADRGRSGDRRRRATVAGSTQMTVNAAPSPFPVATGRGGNVDAGELDKFAALAHQWWDPESPMFGPLHKMNPLRLDWIERMAEGLDGKRVVDIGCGGGILTEAIAARGGETLGIDLGDKALGVARLHKLESGTTADYRLVSAEALAAEMPGAFDVVTCMEMLEHVPDPAAIVAACASLVRPGGVVVVSTINRNLKSYALAVVAAEYLLRLLPKGTHDYAKFLTPAEIAASARRSGLESKAITGVAYNPVTKVFGCPTMPTSTT
jgi:2-polyprenyl-6-hydroxyphenyl methylase/3-demethylubiquinone-9 3-methyltransferase